MKKVSIKVKTRKRKKKILLQETLSALIYEHEMSQCNGTILRFPFQNLYTLIHKHIY